MSSNKGRVAFEFILERVACVCVCLCAQKEMHFDESLVQKQLRYTGMLETVRMRKSGYGAKYTFEVGY